MSTLPRKRNYVPARPDGWLRAFWRWLTTRPPANPRRYESTLPAVSQQPILIHTETPPAVWHCRDRAAEARKLLHRYLKGQPTSRRPCTVAGMSDGAWRRARQTLIRAGVIDRKAQLLYHGRDAQCRLDAYLAQVERRCYESGRYVAP